MNSPAAPYINCPHCSTIFAAPASLPEHGKVRCGVCSGVLEAKLHELHELPDEPINAEQAPVDEVNDDPAATAEPVEAIDGGFDLDDLAPGEEQGFTEQTVNLDSESGSEPDDVFAIEAGEADDADEEAIDLSLPVSQSDGDETSGDIDLADLVDRPPGHDEVNDGSASDLTDEPDGAVDLASLMADEGIPFDSNSLDEPVEIPDDAEETWFEPGDDEEGDVPSDGMTPAAGEVLESTDPVNDNLDLDGDNEVAGELDIGSPVIADEADDVEDRSGFAPPVEAEAVASQAETDDVLFAPDISDDDQSLTDMAEVEAPQDEPEPRMGVEDGAVEPAELDESAVENLDPPPVDELGDGALLAEDEQNEDEEEDPAARAEEDQQADRLFAAAADAPLDELFDSDVETVGGEEHDSSASGDEIFEIDEVAEADEVVTDDEEEIRTGDDPVEPAVEEQLDFGDTDNIDAPEAPADSATLIEPAQSSLSEDDLKPVRVSRWWLVAHLGMALLLVVVIAAQILYLTREPLQDDERFRPWQETLCNLVGCELPVRRDVSKLGAVAKVVISHPRYLDALRIDLSLQNRAAFAQPFPTIRVLFLDKRDRELAGRDFAPEEYLRGPLAGKTLLQPMVPEQIVLEIKDPGPRAVNYRFSYL
jgi:hypothetical protein